MRDIKPIMAEYQNRLKEVEAINIPTQQHWQLFPKSTIIGLISENQVRTKKNTAIKIIYIGKFVSPSSLYQYQCNKNTPLLLNVNKTQ